MFDARRSICELGLNWVLGFSSDLYLVLLFVFWVSSDEFVGFSFSPIGFLGFAKFSLGKGRSLVLLRIRLWGAWFPLAEARS